MKFAVIAALTVIHVGPAIAEEPPFPHEYLNGGYFSVQTAAVETVQAGEAFPHVYENGGHFEGAAPELGDAAD